MSRDHGVMSRPILAEDRPDFDIVDLAHVLSDDPVQKCLRKHNNRRSASFSACVCIVCVSLCVLSDRDCVQSAVSRSAGGLEV